MANANFYNVELRDKAGTLKAYLTPEAADVSWQWNRLGGCGRCTIKLQKEYRDINFSGADDIQIRLRSQTSGLDDYTKLLAHFDGVDGATSHTAKTGQVVTFVADAQLDTAQKKFGTASLLLDGTGDYVTVPDSDDWAFGAGDFTIDFQVRFNSLAGYQKFMCQRSDLENYWQFGKLTTTNKLQLSFKAGNVLKASYVMSSDWAGAVDTWYHIALVRSGSNVYLFIDGVSQTLTTGTAIGTNDVGNIASVLNIGSYYASTHCVNGWMDEVRISKGIARWTADFTPPTRAYGGPSKLVYRGWVSGVIPSLSIPQKITLNVRGYFDFLDYIIIHDGGEKKTYENYGISAIVGDIIDTFVTTPTDITKGTIDTASFSADKLEFKGKVSEALKTLAEIEGGVEYGVDENLVFYWRAESRTLVHKFLIGDNVNIFERRIVWDRLVNKIYFEGGLVNDTPYIKISGATDSQLRHFLAEATVSNSSITTDGVASRFLSAKLKESAKTPLTLKVKVLNTDKRLEDNIPVGRVGIFDKDYDQTLKKWGTTANGGDNLIWGTLKNGGSGGIWGGMYKDQINSIKYTLSNTEGRFNLELTFGGSLLDTSAKLKQMDLQLSSLQQRS